MTTTPTAAELLALADEIDKTVKVQREDGWPVTLTLNDKRVEQITFALRAAASPAGEPVAEVVLFDPRIHDPLDVAPYTKAVEPYKIIDASLWWIDQAPIGTKLYAYPPAPTYQDGVEATKAREIFYETLKQYGGQPYSRIAIDAALNRALSDAPAQPIGWLFHNPDTGTEFSEGHPVESGECDDAENIRPATAEVLRDELLESWRTAQDEREHRAPAQPERGGDTEETNSVAEPSQCKNLVAPGESKEAGAATGDAPVASASTLSGPSEATASPQPAVAVPGREVCDLETARKIVDEFWYFREDNDGECPSLGDLGDAAIYLKSHVAALDARIENERSPENERAMKIIRNAATALSRASVPEAGRDIDAISGCADDQDLFATASVEDVARDVVTDWLEMFDPPPQIDFQQSELLQAGIASVIGKARTLPTPPHRGAAVMRKLTEVDHDAIEMLKDICERADAFGISLVKFPVREVRRLIAIIRRSRSRRRR